MGQPRGARTYSYISCAQPSQISTNFYDNFFHSISHTVVNTSEFLRTKSSRGSCIFSPTKYIPMRSCEILFSHETGDCCSFPTVLYAVRTPFSHILIINVVVWNSILVFRVLRGTCIFWEFSRVVLHAVAK